MEYSTIIGSSGVSILLIAFVLSQMKIIRTTDISYSLMNILGAGLSAWSSYLIDFLPFIILESTWALVSLTMLLRKLMPLRKIFYNRLSVVGVS